VKKSHTTPQSHQEKQKQFFVALCEFIMLLTNTNFKKLFEKPERQLLW
jgi:hypothetical protein